MDINLLFEREQYYELRKDSFYDFEKDDELTEPPSNLM